MEVSFRTDIFTNDITANIGSSRICDASQLPDAASRKFWDISGSDRAHGASGGVDSGPTEVPENIFAVGANNIFVVYPVSSADLLTAGGVCALATSQASSNLKSHWIYNRETFEIFAGTNTAGISECSF